MLPAALAAAAVRSRGKTGNRMLPERGPNPPEDLPEFIHDAPFRQSCVKLMLTIYVQIISSEKMA